MTKIQKVPTASFSPYYGCVIMIAAILVFGGIIGWSIYSLLSQDKQIATFAVDAPVPLPDSTLPANEEAALNARLAEFGLQVAARQPATLSLSIAELNALLPKAPDTGHGSYINLIRFKGTDPTKNLLWADASLPMNHIKFWEDKKRYLNGELAYQLETHPENGLDAKVVDVKVPGKTVPEGFIFGMGSWPWLSPYRDLHPLGTVLKAIRKAEITPTGITLTTQP